MDNLFILHESDNVGIRPDGHKQALRDIKAGEAVVKYGFPIGNATRDITAGEWVHTHNLKSALSGESEYEYKPTEYDISRYRTRDTFEGYLRPDGSVGIRNEIWIIPTVGCVNKAAERLAAAANALDDIAANCGGVFAFTHPYGCSQLGDDEETTQRILAGLAKNPNAGGTLILGLGCENNNIERFKPFLGEYDPRRIKFLTAQEVDDELEAGLALIRSLAGFTSAQKRSTQPVSKLTIGLKCGGSDGFSGLTANPVIGRVADRLCASGGIAALTEVPEMFGAETILMSRCADRETFDSTVELINGFKRYFISHGQSVGENPSPGNKAGGITTLEEKSLGCVQKGGSAPVVGVRGVGYPLRETVCGGKPSDGGLVLVDGPGNDMVACTNLTAAGAVLILFSTGRGTPLGAPVPTLKIATNSSLAQRKAAWIDFCAMGDTVESRGGELWRLTLETASGKAAKNELHGFREIAIFKNGVTL